MKPNLDHFDAFELVLPWPPSINHYWAAVQNRLVLRRQGRKYRRAVAEALMLQPGPRDIGTYVTVEVRAFVPDERTRDLDNLPKAVFDSLTEAGVWRDDSIVQRFSVSHERNWEISGFLLVKIAPTHPAEYRRDDALTERVRAIVPKAK